jgi:hypothetical protein
MLNEYGEGFKVQLRAEEWPSWLEGGALEK